MNRAATLSQQQTHWPFDTLLAPAAPEPGRPDTGLYRYVGPDLSADPFDPAGVDVGPGLPFEDAQLFVEEPQPSYLDRPVSMPKEYYTADLPEQPRLTVGREAATKLALLVVVAALLALAFALVNPALAATRYGPNVLSRYTEASIAAAAGLNPAPVIDVAPGVEAPAAPAAPAPAAPAPAGSYSLIGGPSISVGQIETVLKQYGSPAQGLGQTLYDLGVRYGIDPAYALAFFVHESGCGTKGVARFTQSLGNIRWTPQYDNYEGYRKYASWEAGMEDWYKLITDLYVNQWGLRTVDSIIPVYAPTGDGNSPPSYIASVKYMVDSWRGK